MQDIHLGDAGDLRFTGDFIGIEFHGDAHSHIDALCHMAYKGLMYNGVPVERGRDLAGRQQADDGRGEGGPGRPRRADRHPAPAGDETGSSRATSSTPTRSRRPSRRRAPGWPRATSCSCGPGTRASGWTRGRGRRRTRRRACTPRSCRCSTRPRRRRDRLGRRRRDGPEPVRGRRLPDPRHRDLRDGPLLRWTASPSRTWPRRASRSAGGSSSASSRRCGSRRARARR